MYKKSFILALALLLMVVPGIAYGHGMHLRLIEPGRLQVEYDGGGFSSRTEVTIYDKSGAELDKGLVDENGEFTFDPDLDVERAIANDGLGHQAEYKKGSTTTTIPKLPVVLVVFILAGAIYYFYSKKTEKKKS